MSLACSAGSEHPSTVPVKNLLGTSSKPASLVDRYGWSPFLFHYHVFAACILCHELTQAIIQAFNAFL